MKSTGFDDVQKKRMFLSQETLLGLRITSELLGTDRYNLLL